MNQPRPSGSPSEALFQILNYAFLGLVTLACLYPFWYVIVYALSDSLQAGAQGVYLWPVGFTLDNLAAVMKLPNIGTSIVVSVLRTVVGTLVTVFCSSFFAYLLTQKEMPARKVLYRFAVVTMYLSAGLIPWYITMKTLGLRNNPLVYILPSAIGVFFVVLIKTYIEQIPASLGEAAKIDGAGPFLTFWKVVFPVCKPIVATVAIFASVNQWNSWIDNFFLVPDEHLSTLQLLLYNYLNDAQRLASASGQELARGGMGRSQSPDTIRVTVTVIATLPVLVYPFLQKYFAKGLMLGAVKG